MAGYLSVLIADDEPRIVQLIIKSIDWQQLGLVCVGTAHDGESAKALLDKLKPDILITDIRMPEISGLELTQYAHKHNLGTQIIIISGYKQFDYAFQALKHGAVDFLIKPINRRDLNNVLLRICEKRSNVVVSREYIDMLKQRVEVAERQRRKQYLTNCISNIRPLDDEGVDFAGDTLFAVAVKVDMTHSFDESDLRIMEKIDAIVRDEFGAHDFDCETVPVNDMVLCVLGVDGGDIESVYRVAGKCMRQVKSRLDVYAHLMISMGISRPHPMDQAPEPCVQEATQAVLCRTVLGNDDVIDARDIDLTPPVPLVTLTDARRIQQYLETLDGDGLCDYIGQIAARYHGQYARGPRQLRGLIHELCDTIQARRNLLEDDSSSDMWDAVAYALEECTSFDGMLGALTDAARDLIRASETYRKTRNSVPIRTVKEYIAQHMNEDISLESISVAIGFSKNYLCKLFKNEMDTTIVTYITEVRLGAAKKLLTNTLLNISEIAQQVGYEDTKYFSRQFTRFVGVTPREYRRVSPA